MKKAVKSQGRKKNIQSKEQTVLEIPSKKSKDTELYWVIGTMIALIAVFFISSYIFQNINKIEYNGLTFTKEKAGDLIFYHYYYFVSNEDGVTNEFHMYLRTDPRKNDVNVTGDIELFSDIPVYLSLNLTALSPCNYSTVALGSFGNFLTYNFINIKPATLERNISLGINDTNYVTCNNHPDRMVFEINEGDKTSIVKVSPKCYKITFTNCEILPAVEKFQIQTVLNAKARSSQSSSRAYNLN